MFLFQNSLCLGILVVLKAALLSGVAQCTVSFHLDLTPEAYTTKQVQHTQDIFSLSGFTYPDKRNHTKRSHDGGYQFVKSTQVFTI